jgi:hypothetical protein
MARSLLRQLEQIRRSATYDDVVASVNTAGVAEPTVSGSLEADMNVVRSLMKQLKGGTNWYDDPGMYFDPTNTTSGSADTKQMSLANIKGKTTDSQTVIIAVSEDAAGAGYAVVSGTAEIDVNITTLGAVATDREGLPVYEATTPGTFWDEGGSMNVCRVDVIDSNTDAEFEDGSGNTIFAVIKEKSDGTDVYMKFMVNDTSPTPYTFDGTEGVSNVYFIYPQRKVMSNVAEYEWMRTDFVSSWEGDVELIEDITNLWAFTGSGDNISNPTWTNTTNYYILDVDVDLEAAINLLNNGIGDRTYTEDNYIDDGDTISESLNELDMALRDVEDMVEAGIEEKYVEELSADVPAGTPHSLPAGITYTPDSTSGQEGGNMDILLDGQLLSASTGANGVNEDRDYAETTASGITFHIDVHQYSNVTYRVRQ